MKMVETARLYTQLYNLEKLGEIESKFQKLIKCETFSLKLYVHTKVQDQKILGASSSFLYDLGRLASAHDAIHRVDITESGMI